MDEFNFITLRCRDCENYKCSTAARYIDYNSKEGCTKRIPSALADKYYYYSAEVWPFIIHDDRYSKSYIDEIYQKYINILEEIYSYPIGKRIDPRGKAILS